METIIHSTTGWIHFITASIAMISGTAILVLPKGTKQHKGVGYWYVVSMLIMLATSFMLYGLFGGFGVFHVASIVSTLTLIAGMIPAWRRKPGSNWVSYHFSFMYWSVLGLYAAFFSEILTRVPTTPFFGMVGIASLLTFGIGGYVFSKKKKQWFAIFASKA